MLFRGKKSPDKTILILDVESGSVGSALVRLSPDKQPKLFGETRFTTPLRTSRSGEQLSRAIEEAAHEAVLNASEVAARIRMHDEVAPLGAIDHVAIFMSAPWGRPNLLESRPDFLPKMTEVLTEEVARSFGYVPSSFYTGAGAAAFGTRAAVSKEPCLVCVVTGEVSELMRMDEEGVAAHATIPTGSHALLRTLRTHGGLSEAEARSAARLPFESTRMREPFAAAGSHFAEQFKDAARELAQPGEVLQVRIIGLEPTAECFARALGRSPTGAALAEDSLAELFPQGGEVRALRARHLTPHIAAHAPNPDVMLLLAALFVDSHF